MVVNIVLFDDMPQYREIKTLSLKRAIASILSQAAADNLELTIKFSSPTDEIEFLGQVEYINSMPDEKLICLLDYDLTQAAEKWNGNDFAKYIKDLLGERSFIIGISGVAEAQSEFIDQFVGKTTGTGELKSGLSSAIYSLTGYEHVEPDENTRPQ